MIGRTNAGVVAEFRDRSKQYWPHELLVAGQQGKNLYRYGAQSTISFLNDI